ncbi:proteasome assembly chaperone family protein [Methanomassiliicoccus luminyensis]|jgi:uncharacterized protein|uniref:proteasome assembly chaperone family protein n=1 Tax=Methanomassiliicoccus luminyensis TaxID=1080712 RepID=UPI00036DC266|nr:PAC2 family protein [Methanomassiliicoccus luminyensis]
MSSDLKIHEYKNDKFTNGMMIVGFPSVGLVSSIAANFIIRTSKLERVAGMVSDDFPPYTLVHDGSPSPPVRIYAGERECSDGEDCKQLVTVAAEFMPRPEQVQKLATAVMDYCQEKGIKTIVALEGINWMSSEEPKIQGVASTPASRELMSKYGVEEMKDGMVSGLSGVLLYQGEMRGLDVICLLGPARVDLPDARGSAKLLEVVAKMLPELKIDPEPLYKEAEEIERQIKQAMSSVNQPKKPSLEESVVYG